MIDWLKIVIYNAATNGRASRRAQHMVDRPQLTVIQGGLAQSESWSEEDEQDRADGFQGKVVFASRSVETLEVPVIKTFVGSTPNEMDEAANEFNRRNAESGDLLFASITDGVRQQDGSWACQGHYIKEYSLNDPS